MRDRETVFIFYELVMRPFDIAKDPTFSLETFYYLLCISLHKVTLIHNKKNARNYAKCCAQKMETEVGINRAGEPLRSLPRLQSPARTLALIGTHKQLNKITITWV